MANTTDIAQQNLWKRLNSKKSTKLSIRIILVLFFIALFSNFIANDRPLYCKIDGKAYYPITNMILHNLGWSKVKVPRPGVAWYDLNYEIAIWPVIPFAGNTLDLHNAYRPPFSSIKKNNRFRHYLGTGMLGKDIAAGLVQGTRLAMIVGILSILLASLIGIFIGGIAGFVGDYNFKLSWLSIVGLVLGMITTVYYINVIYQLWSSNEASVFADTSLFMLSILVAILLGIIVFGVLHYLAKKLNIRQDKNIPLDLLLMRFIEIIQSIPALLILLILAGMFSSRSISVIIFIIAFIKWAGIAKFIRAELLQIRSMPYIQSARASGLNELQILLRHAIPNALTPIYIAMAFGISSAILLEATISFLGIGVEQEIMSWGKMLAQARQKPSAWWLAIFPGFMIFICVVAFNLIGDRISKIYKL